MSKPPLVLGTNNKKKLRELKLLLEPFGFQLQSLGDIDNPIEVEETGETFQENARLKACEQAKHLNKWVIGEDSGLSVEVLNGQPGVYSARFAGEDANDELNNAKLLEELENFPREKRTAFYTCHVTLSSPTGQPVIDCEEYCRGLIRTKPSGSAGFGYDPLFEVPEYGLTFGEMGDGVKSILSHRARAIRRFVELLKCFDFE